MREEVAIEWGVTMNQTNDIDQTHAHENSVIKYNNLA